MSQEELIAKLTTENKQLKTEITTLRAALQKLESIRAQMAAKLFYTKSCYRDINGLRKRR